MIAAQLDQNNTVINIIVVDSLDALPNLVDGAGAVRGATYDPDTQQFTPPQSVAVVPESVTMRQAEIALLESGNLAAVESWVETQGGELKSYWKRSQVVRREHAFVDAARVELGLTSQQMDSLFVLAASKEA